MQNFESKRLLAEKLFKVTSCAVLREKQTGKSRKVNVKGHFIKEYRYI